MNELITLKRAGLKFEREISLLIWLNPILPLKLMLVRDENIKSNS